MEVGRDYIHGGVGVVENPQTDSTLELGIELLDGDGDLLVFRQKGNGPPPPLILSQSCIQITIMKLEIRIIETAKILERARVWCVCLSPVKSVMSSVREWR